MASCLITAVAAVANEDVVGFGRHDLLVVFYYYQIVRLLLLPVSLFFYKHKWFIGNIFKRVVVIIGITLPLNYFIVCNFS